MLSPACARTHYLTDTEPALGDQRPNSLATLLCVNKVFAIRAGNDRIHCVSR
jgi:hypothetical protein